MPQYKAAGPRRAACGRACARSARPPRPEGAVGPLPRVVRDLRPLRKRGLARPGVGTPGSVRRVPPRRVAPGPAAPPLSTQSRHM
jgi:hypothetical protein